MKIKIYLFSVMALLMCICMSQTSFAQIEVSLTGTASHSGGGATVYAATNYNDNTNTSLIGCAATLPWGWVTSNGWIQYQWSSSVTFNKILFQKADRPMYTTTCQWWDGSSWNTFYNYSNTSGCDDSITFSPITTTGLQFLSVSGSSNPNHREIQVWSTGTIPPTVTGNTIYCSGTTLTLTANTPTANATYNWTGPNGFTANTATIVIPNISTSQAGLYNVTATAGTSTSTAVTTLVSVNQSPPTPTISNNGPLCAGSTLVFTNSTPYPGGTYSWTGPNSFSSTVLNPSIPSVTTSATGIYSLTVTAPNGCSSPFPATTTATLLSPPAIVVQPFDASICPGGNSGFSLTATGTGLTYQWQADTGTGFANISNGVVYSGVTSSSLSLVTPPGSMAGNYYRCVIHSACGQIDTSNSVVLTVFNAPNIVTNPHNDTACEGSNFTMHVGATGSSLQYQWQVNTGSGFVNLVNAGGTSGVYTSTLSIIFLPYSFNGYRFRCVVSAGGCNPFLTTDSATLMVRPLPNVTMQPIANATCIGGGAAFYVGGVGYGLGYQWQVNTGTGYVDISNSPTYGGTTDSVLTIANVGSNMNGYYYRAKLTGFCASTAYSNAVPLNIVSAPTAVLTPQGSTSICPSDSLLLLATQALGYNYQWKYNNVNIPGATGPAYAAHNAGSYALTVSIGGGNCSQTTAPVTVSVLTAPSASVTAAGPTSFCQGGSVTLNGNQSSALSYTWYNNGVLISGANTSSYVATTSGSFQMNTYNGSCNTRSAAVNVTVNTKPSANIYYSGTGYFCVGSSVTLPANIGTGFTYQWLVSNFPISGATANSYTTPNSGNYKVVVTNSAGCSDTSSQVSLISAPVPPAIVTAVGPTTVCTGNSVILNASLGSNLTYQWTDQNGSPIAGATNATFNATTTGSYFVIVTNLNGLGCSQVSAPTAVTVNNHPLPPATITYSGNSVICFGDSSILQGNSGTGYSYQWQVNGTDINGATSSLYTAHSGGQYVVLITDANGCIGTSATITLVQDTPLSPMVYKAGNVLSTGNTYATYQWYKDGNQIGGATANSYNTNGVPGSYKVLVFDVAGCSKFSAPRTIVGVNNIDNLHHDVRIFPNPATTLVYIESDVKVNVLITSVEGRTLLQKNNASSLEIGELPTGVYIMQVFDENNVLLKAERFIKTNR